MDEKLINDIYEEVSKPVKSDIDLIKKQMQILEELYKIQQTLPKKEFNKFAKPIFKQLEQQLKN